MLRGNDRLRPRTDEVASKVMDGEAIIINLANGVYYSLDKAGGVVWEHVSAMRTVAEAVSAVAARYDVPLETATRDVEQLLDELLREELVAVTEGDGQPSPIGAAAGERLPYERPALNVYRDMGDLLALDPPTPGLDSPWKDPEERAS